MLFSIFVNLKFVLLGYLSFLKLKTYDIVKLIECSKKYKYIDTYLSTKVLQMFIEIRNYTIYFYTVSCKVSCKL